MIIPPILKPENVKGLMEIENQLYALNMEKIKLGGRATMKDLGFANGWKNTPEIVKVCKELGHIQYEYNAGRCLHEYGCGACKYKYFVDSSD